MFRSLLIANRGEIAVRVARTCRRLGIRTVGVYSAADRGALHTRVVDQAIPIGPASAAQSYLNADAILEAARATGAEALHPGYGFLSESPAFAQRCRDAGVAFVGPPPEAMRLLGDKAAARRLAADLGLPLLPGLEGEAEDLLAGAEGLGFPLMVKAAAGGGGRGMRVVQEASELAEALRAAAREAAAAFGDGRLILERYVGRARHVEVQVIADDHGTVLTLGERDCSTQRRHQKVVEEAPAPHLDDATRRRMAETAACLVRAAGYRNAGTVELLLAPDGSFTFMEVNARLQVEHPVTEAVTGLDLVELQLRVAAGEPLGLTQEQVRTTGHAIEARIYAEDPEHDYLPATGWLTAFDPPRLPGVRHDVGVEAGWQVQSYYDPLLAKLIVHTPDRPTAVALLREALARYRVEGVITNLPQLRAVAGDPAFSAGDVWLGLLAAHGLTAQEPPFEALAAAVVEALAPPAAGDAPWQARGPWRQLRQFMPLRLRAGQRLFEIEASAAATGWLITVDGLGSARPCTAQAHALDQARLQLRLSLSGGLGPCEAVVERLPDARLVCLNGQVYRLDLDRPRPPGPGATQAVAAGLTAITAPLPGRLVALPVAEGEAVAANQTVAVLEAMKMEHAVRSPSAGTIARLPIPLGAQVAHGDVLAELR